MIRIRLIVLEKSTFEPQNRVWTHKSGCRVGHCLSSHGDHQDLYQKKVQKVIMGNNNNNDVYLPSKYSTKTSFRNKYVFSEDRN